MIKNKINFFFLKLIFCGLVFAHPSFVFSQSADSIQHKNRKLYFWSGYGLGYSISMYVLYQVWYKNFKHSSFHWFNDNHEWYQMDKVGHVYSSFHIAQSTFHGLKWVGYPHQKAVLWASITSFITISSIELFDAYSIKWGASYSDLIANSAGTALFYIQRSTKYSPLTIKFSFHKSQYAEQRPDALGKYWYEQVIKDYNGQTYWLSINPYECGIKKIPQWINISLGYSAEKMINATDDNAYRQYFFSLDINSKSINTKNKWLNTLLKSFNILKIPFPTLEYSKNKWYGHWFYF
ncbi:MAG: DUF2279 domain-containing protein [Bacteroidales bacterium]